MRVPDRKEPDPHPSLSRSRLRRISLRLKRARVRSAGMTTEQAFDFAFLILPFALASRRYDFLNILSKNPSRVSLSTIALS